MRTGDGAASTVNEDNGFWDKTDEIYVDAVLLDGDLRDHRVYGNVVVAQF